MIPRNHDVAQTNVLSTRCKQVCTIYVYNIHVKHIYKYVYIYILCNTIQRFLGKPWPLQQTLFMISPCQVSALVLDHGSIHAVHVETYNLSRCGWKGEDLTPISCAKVNTGDKLYSISLLVVEPTPLENISQIGSFPLVRLKLFLKKNSKKHHLIRHVFFQPGSRKGKKPCAKKRKCFILFSSSRISFSWPDNCPSMRIFFLACIYSEDSPYERVVYCLAGVEVTLEFCSF